MFKYLDQWSNPTVNTDGNIKLTFPVVTHNTYGIFVTIDTNICTLNNDCGGPAFITKPSTKDCIIYNDFYVGIIHTLIIGN